MRCQAPLSPLCSSGLRVPRQISLPRKCRTNGGLEAPRVVFLHPPDGMGATCPRLCESLHRTFPTVPKSLRREYGWCSRHRRHPAE